MPDFEALIRHQQNQQRSAPERLKIVEPLINERQLNSAKENVNYSLFLGFLGGIISSILCTTIILISVEKGWLSLQPILNALNIFN